MRPASVAESERRLRFAELRSWANRLGEELRLTPLGLGLLAAAGRVPQRWEEQPEPARPQLERLARAGLIAADGMVVPSAQTAAEALATPGALLSIEASRGSASASWTAWFGTACAVIAATRPVDLPSLGDGPASLEGDDELTVQIGVPGWAPLAAAIWLELTPRPR